MRFILVVERKHLFPGLSPQGFLPSSSLDLDGLSNRLFFAEREYMEQNSHFKQIIPYLMLQRGTGDDARVLCYQRRVKHSESRLGGRWSVGFGGHIEPVDTDPGDLRSHGLVQTTALREMEEETGLNPGAGALELIGYINSDIYDVSSVHFGVVFKVDLNGLPDSDEEVLDLVSRQAEPHQARWIGAAALPDLIGPERGPDGGTFEDWSRIAVDGAFGTGS